MPKVVHTFMPYFVLCMRKIPGNESYWQLTAFFNNTMVTQGISGKINYQLGFFDLFSVIFYES